MYHVVREYGLPCARNTFFYWPIYSVEVAGKYFALSLEFMNLRQNFHIAVIEYLCRGRRAVPLQTLT